MKKLLFDILGLFENLLRWTVPVVLAVIAIGTVAMSVPQLKQINYAENIKTISVIVGIFVVFFIIFFLTNKKGSISNAPSNIMSLFRYKRPDYTKTFPFPLVTVAIVLFSISILGTLVSAGLTQ